MTVCSRFALQAWGTEFDPQDPTKTLDTVEGTCDPSTVEWETGRFPGVTGQPMKSTGNQQASEGLCLRERWQYWVNVPEVVPCSAMYTSAQAWTRAHRTHTHTHTHHLHIYPYAHQQRTTHRELVINVAKEQRDQRKDTLREEQHRKKDCPGLLGQRTGS